MVFGLQWPMKISEPLPARAFAAFPPKMFSCAVFHGVGNIVQGFHGFVVHRCIPHGVLSDGVFGFRKMIARQQFVADIGREAESLEEKARQLEQQLLS